MKNTIFSIIKYVYYFSFLVLLILYLFPGSLVGYFLYNNLGHQPDLISNPIGTSLNHLLFFMYLSFLGFIIRIQKELFLNSLSFLFGIAIFLELAHIIIPNRAFEFYDLFANSAGVALSFFFIRLLKGLKIIY